MKLYIKNKKIDTIRFQGTSLKPWVNEHPHWYRGKAIDNASSFQQ
jgi:hypothetical protein